VYRYKEVAETGTTLRVYPTLRSVSYANFTDVHKMITKYSEDRAFFYGSQAEASAKQRGDWPKEPYLNTSGATTKFEQLNASTHRADTTSTTTTATVSTTFTTSAASSTSSTASATSTASLTSSTPNKLVLHP